MSNWNDYRTFWREFRETFHTTGSVIPSGRNLCRALASQVSRRGQPQRILEVGPGTGVVTEEIVRRMGTDDQLDLVEINPRFAEILRRRLVEEWQEVAARVRLFEMPIEKVPPGEDHCYDCIVSGLPLSNFSGDLVTLILCHIQLLATEGATLSFFEYVAIRKLKALVSGAAERRRLREISIIFDKCFVDWEFHRQCVLANVPPAWVHHLRFAAPLSAATKVQLVQPSTC